jgi:hypothetical protein
MKELVTRGISSEAYRTFFEEVVAKGEPYGPPDAGHGIDYTKLNLARTRRIEKTLKVPANVQEAMAQARPQSWMVITEPWCGDGAQNLPVLQALAALAPKIDMHILLRDSHLEVMSHRFQRLFQIPDQVFRVFHAHAEAHQAAGDAELLALHGVHANMRHGGGVLRK